MHEEIYHLRREQRKGRRHNNRKSDFHHQIKTQDFFQAFCIFCAIIVAQQRLCAERKANHNEYHNHVHLHSDSHRCDLVGTVLHKITVRQGDAEALHDIRNRSRDADRQNPAKRHRFNPDLLWRYSQLMALCFHKINEQNICSHISKHRSDRRSARAHPKSKDKDRIQNNVHNGACDRRDHRLYGKPLRPDQIARCQRDNDEGRTICHIPVVLQSILHRILCCAEQTQDRRLKKQHQQGHSYTT